MDLGEATRIIIVEPIRVPTQLPQSEPATNIPHTGSEPTHRPVEEPVLVPVRHPRPYRPRPLRNVDGKGSAKSGLTAVGATRTHEPI